MLLSSLEQLLSPTGQSALAEAVILAPEESTFLTCHNRLSKRFGSDLARVALETALLRRKARSKFSRAESMYFTREALEQATSEVVAMYRAERYAGEDHGADLCCGIGGDAVALASRTRILAVDSDPVRLEMTRLNLRAYGVEDRAECVVGDVLTVPLPDVTAVFFDPSRRVQGRRVISIRDSQPSLEAVRGRLSADTAMGVKLAPAVSWNDVDDYSGEVEFISLDGELKECMLWTGRLAGPRRRATVLPQRATLFAERPASSIPVGPVGQWLYDPDPAITRAGLVTDLAHYLQAWPIDPAIAYLSSDRLIETPFARVLQIESAMPAQLREVRAHLKNLGVGRVEVRRRGSAIDPEDFRRQLKLSGSGFRVLVLTQIVGRPSVLIGLPAGGAAKAESSTMSE